MANSDSSDLPKPDALSVKIRRRLQQVRADAQVEELQRQFDSIAAIDFFEAREREPQTF